MRPRDTQRRSLPLQYIRGLAAMLVVVFHASFYLKAWRGDDWFLRVFEGYISAGQLGVTLFFVTSGALMAQLATGDPSRFLLHRIVRIYPTYLLVALSMLQLAPLLATNVTFDPWVLGLVAGPGHHYGLGTEWTLPFEITYYLVIFGCMSVGIGRYAALIGAGWIVANLVVHFQWPQLQADFQFPTLAQIPVATNTLSFAAGMLVPWAVGRCGNWLAGASVLGVAVLVASVWDPAHRIWLYSAAGCCFVAAALTPLAIRARPVRSLARLGDWSYAIYLCHAQVVIAVLRFGPDLPTWCLWFAAMVVGTGAGCLIGLVDLPLYSVLRRQADRLPTGVRWGLSLAFLAAYVVAGLIWML